ncbi:MAG TPA: hypothetical protein VG675_20620 [Bryobacteraceae bacterium]|nr:hypothetical protein [Bryobacteraceae bacterium]
MLFFLGKDVLRWVGQCLEWATHYTEFNTADLCSQSFAALLTVDPPEPVKEKLTLWGVADYASIFSRAIGLNALFAEPPFFDVLNEEFLRNYHRYADHLYRCFMESRQYCAICPVNFRFELFASGEYSRMLESEWGAQ